MIPNLGSTPRVRLGHFPTPIEKMPRLGALLGIDDLWVKRDDCTGIALGGNKIRKLEFCIGAAIAESADCIVSGGVVQSNNVRQVAGACARLGIECHLAIMQGRVPQTEPTYGVGGNMLLNHLLGAHIHRLPWNEDRNRQLHQILEQLKSKGRKPYLVPYGASDRIGALGYVLAAAEIAQDFPKADWIVHASGSAGTQAGLLVGFLAIGFSVRVIGIDVDAQPERVRSDVCHLGASLARSLGIAELWSDDLVRVDGRWSAGAYGVADRGTEEAISLAARLEALLLDPVYSGKSMAGLIGLARDGNFRPNDTVVWLHTGGAPGIFAHQKVMERAANWRPYPNLDRVGECQTHNLDRIETKPSGSASKP